MFAAGASFLSRKGGGSWATKWVMGLQIPRKACKTPNTICSRLRNLTGSPLRDVFTVFSSWEPAGQLRLFEAWKPGMYRTFHFFSRTMSPQAAGRRLCLYPDKVVIIKFRANKVWKKQGQVTLLINKKGLKLKLLLNFLICTKLNKLSV
jgi:hypothetical protein